MAAVCVPMRTEFRIAEDRESVPDSRTEPYRVDDDDERMSDVDETGPMEGEEEKITHAVSKLGENKTVATGTPTTERCTSSPATTGPQDGEANRQASNPTACRSLVLYNPTSSPWSLVPRFKVNPSEDGTLRPGAPPKEEDKPKPPVGLRNLGNTCYFNSALQMLMSIEGFGEEMKQLVEELNRVQAKNEDKDGFVLVDKEVIREQATKQLIEGTAKELEENHLKNTESQQEAEDVKPHEAKKAKIATEGEGQAKEADGNGVQEEETDENDPLFGCFGLFGDEDSGGYNIVNHEETVENNTGDTKVLSLREALVNLWKKAEASARQEEPEPVSPNEMKRTVDVVTPLFVGYRQQDAHEFLSTLLDLLHDEIVTVQKEIMDKAKMMEENTERDPCNKEQPDGLAGLLIAEATGGGLETSEVHSQPSKPDQTPKVDETVSEAMSLDDDAAAHSSQQCREAEPSGLAPVPKYSQLNVEAIGDLLHGESDRRNEPELTRKDETKSPGRLVGGRAVPATCGVVVSSSPMETSGDFIVDDISSDWNEIGSPAMDVGPEGRLVAVGGTGEDGENGENGDTEKKQPLVQVSDTALSATEFGVRENGCTEAEDPLPTTPVDDFFTVELRTRLTCDSCKFSRTRQEIFRHLSIEVNSNDTADRRDKNPTPAPIFSTIEEGLRQFFATEKLNVKCEKCYHETATQTKEITRLPKALLVHFKRFIVDISPDYKSVTYRKDQTEMEFGESLELSSSASKGEAVLAEFLAPDVSIPQVGEQCDDETEETVGMDCSMSSADTVEEGDTVPITNSVHNSFKRRLPHYKLRSVVNHIGSSANCGHYTADVDALYFLPDSRSEARQWTRLNDSRVSPTSLQSATTGSARKTAYMVMYALE